MKEVYGGDTPSYGVVKFWHRQFKCGRISVETSISGQPHSAIDDDTIHKGKAAILKDRRITIRQLVREVKISEGSMEKKITTICTRGSCLHDGFPGCSHLLRSSNELTAPRLVWQCSKKMKRTFSVDLSHKMKYGSITMIPRLTMIPRHYDSETTAPRLVWQ
ncbi:uncharacterized protein LOC115222601 [Octopus sinensis]|uniref:Uncharacterized protein LOC115222601 n=1 Tax=Octopus sinensis TaxID=2607531 RepID=A0A6P7TCG0_9MOLL|nr:uncharacterized protein LOC115222601 [Octopus sinensis]